MIEILFKMFMKTLTAKEDTLQMSCAALHELDEKQWKALLLNLQEPSRSHILMYSINLAALSTSQFTTLLFTLKARASSIKTLNLQLAGLQNFSAERWRELCDVLSTLTELQELNIATNDFSKPTPEELLLFFTALTRMQKIQKINLSASKLYKLSPIIWQNSLALLGRLKRLQAMNLSSNQLGSLHPAHYAVLKHLFTNLPCLQSLEWKYSGLAQSSDEHWIALMDALTQATQLESIDLSDNSLCRLPAKHWQLLNQTLRSMPYLFTISLKNNGLQGASAEIWQGCRTSLAATPSLIFIDMDLNELEQVKESEIKVLASAHQEQYWRSYLQQVRAVLPPVIADLVFDFLFNKKAREVFKHLKPYSLKRKGHDVLEVPAADSLPVPSRALSLPVVPSRPVSKQRGIVSSEAVLRIDLFPEDELTLT